MDRIEEYNKKIVARYHMNLGKEEIRHYLVVEELIREMNSPIRFLEVGVDAGAMEKNLLEKFKDIYIMGIDINCNLGVSKMASESEGRFHYVVAPSKEMGKELFMTGEKFDFIYIDGGHKNPCVKEDLEDYFMLVKPNGIFAGHDYGPECWSVKEEVDRMFGDTVNIGPNLTWWIYV